MTHCALPPGEGGHVGQDRALRQNLSIRTNAFQSTARAHWNTCNSRGFPATIQHLWTQSYIESRAEGWQTRCSWNLARWCRFGRLPCGPGLLHCWYAAGFPSNRDRESQQFHQSQLCVFLCFPQHPARYSMSIHEPVSVVMDIVPLVWFPCKHVFHHKPDCSFDIWVDSIQKFWCHHSDTKTNLNWICQAPVGDSGSSQSKAAWQKAEWVCQWFAKFLRHSPSCKRLIGPTPSIHWTFIVRYKKRQ